MQLKYELDKINIELVSLLKNWKKKKNEYLARLVGYRAELKEFKAVLAATEEGHKSFLDLVHPILELSILELSNASDNNVSPVSGTEPPVLAKGETNYLRQLKEFVKAAQEKETARITQARSVYKTNSEHILRKTKEIYRAMEEEKGQVDAYAVILTNNCKATEKQLEVQLKTSGIGIGL
ncbi:hypothetical protein F0145_02420 [Adhaeribacter rhizoryzae]|uniref:Uncharacterized protein n=2 Tax=Adhaeribacter rhizoryzae TaxID=2607907 RepID=A0A5M6DPJ2_9BACT|nr:hypothetical protein F0145_02420 [Adhaeribacter rhizoryzae]